MPSRAKAYLALATMAVLWGAAFPFIKPAFSFVSPYQFLYFRYLIAAPLLLPVLIYYFFKLKPGWKILGAIALIELLGTPLSLSILYQGLKLTSALEASLIGSTGPIFTVIGGIIFLKEKEEKREWRGLLISFIGTIILVCEPLITGRNGQINFSIIGNLLIILSSLINSVYLLMAKKHYQKLPKLFVCSLSYPLAYVSFLLILNFERLSTSISLLSIPQVALASGYMAIFGSIIALALLLYGQSKIEASEASLFTYLQGIVAIPAAWLVLGELPTWPMLLAIPVIALGVFLAEKRV